jgi:outer membrane protein assembly factor BamE (lipoprotein component of BamABCDE complex)
MFSNILFVFLLSIYCACDFSGNDKKEELLFKKIYIGMRPNDVVNILGRPDTVLYFFDSTYEYLYFTKNKSPMRSELPSVKFDTDNRVRFASYGD